MPPSPLLSARMMRITYLSETTIISAQKIVDSPPRTLDVLRTNAVVGVEGFLGRVQGTRADVAVDDAKRGQCQRCERFLETWIVVDHESVLPHRLAENCTLGPGKRKPGASLSRLEPGFQHFRCASVLDSAGLLHRRPDTFLVRCRDANKVLCAGPAATIVGRGSAREVLRLAVRRIRAERGGAGVQERGFDGGARPGLRNVPRAERAGYPERSLSPDRRQAGGLSL